MADDVGTTYFSYRGPSPHDVGGSGMHGHRNTIRSVDSVNSSRGDNNEITTLAVRPYQSSFPDTPTPSQSVLLLSPPYPGSFLPNQPYLAPSYSQFDSLPRDSTMEKSHVIEKVHSDFTKSTETLRQCVLMMSIVFLLVFGVAIFMAVYYGNNYSS